MGRIIHGDSSAPPRLHAESGTESNDSSGSGFNGTAWFMSKERIFDGKRTEADEVWAFGMTLIQVGTVTVYTCFSMHIHQLDPFNSSLYMHTASYSQTAPH